MANNVIDSIQMVDMDKEIKTSRILLDDYDGIERDLCIILVQGYFRNILNTTDPEMNSYGKQKAFVYAKWFTTRRLSSEQNGLHGLVERSKMYMLNDAQTTGWHHALEYEDVSELLASILEGKEGKNEAYDWKFIVEQLIPAAEKVGINPNEIMAASTNVKKMRGLVPAARQLIDKQEKEEVTLEEAEAILRSWIQKTMDPNVTYDGFREELNQWRGIILGRQEPILGYKMIMPNNKWAVYIETQSDKDLAIIEQALKNRVTLTITGFDYLQQAVLGTTEVFNSVSVIAKLEEEQKAALGKRCDNVNSASSS